MFEKYIVSDKHFRNYYENGERLGFIICLRINYYRGIPLSMLHDLKITIDGELFTTEKMAIVLDGKRYHFHEIENISNHNWPFGEELWVEVEKPGGLVPGKKEVEVVLSPRNTYFGVFSGECKRTLTFG